MILFILPALGYMYLAISLAWSYRCRRKIDTLVLHGRIYTAAAYAHHFRGEDSDCDKALALSNHIVDCAEYYLQQGQSMNPLFWIRHWNDDFEVMPPEEQAKRILSKEVA